MRSQQRWSIVNVHYSSVNKLTAQLEGDWRWKDILDHMVSVGHCILGNSLGYSTKGPNLPACCPHSFLLFVLMPTGLLFSLSSHILPPLLRKVPLPSYLSYFLLIL